MTRRTTGRSLARALVAAWPQLVIAAMVGALIALRLAAPLRVLYALGAVALGAYLERRDTPRYVSFVIWLWFLSPLVRRLADLDAGWQDPSLVLLTPYLVTALSVPALLRGLLRPERRAALRVAGVGVFAVAGVGVVIGIPVGMLVGPSTAALETLNWLLPLAFGWYIATRDAPVYRVEAAVASTFVAAALVAGAYGLYQFTSPPLWDINWMQRSGMTTIGRPEPFAVRVFGPMHSPGVFSAFLVIALVLWLARPRTPGAAGGRRGRRRAAAVAGAIGVAGAGDRRAARGRLAHRGAADPHGDARRRGHRPGRAAPVHVRDARARQQPRRHDGAARRRRERRRARDRPRAGAGIRRRPPVGRRHRPDRSQDGAVHLDARQRRRRVAGPVRPVRHAPLRRGVVRPDVAAVELQPPRRQHSGRSPSPRPGSACWHRRGSAWSPPDRSACACG